MTAVTIRLAAPAEHDTVDRLLVDAYAHDYGPQEGDQPAARARDRAAQYDVWVGLDEADVIVGSVTTRRHGGPSLQEDTRDDEFDLRLLGVAPHARRQRIGAGLTRFALREAERLGFTAVVLKSAPEMTGAHRLYASLGFVRTPDRDGLWIGGERVLDLFSFRYDLEQARLAPPAATVRTVAWEMPSEP